MRTTEYLYGVKPHVFQNMKYANAIELKHTLAKKVFHELSKEYTSKNGSWDETFDIRVRLTEVQKAINHNKQLIEELKGEEHV